MVSRRRSADGRVLEALEFAAAAHAGQRRKDGRTPYIVHPVGVFRHLVADLGVEDADLGCTALLHDVVEDSGVTVPEVARRFGPRVARYVAALTVPPELHGERVPGEAKTRRLLDDVGSMPWEAVLVKLCDRWDNLEDVPNAPWDRAKRRYYANQTQRILRALRRRLRLGSPPRKLRSALLRGLDSVRRAARSDAKPDASGGRGRGSGGARARSIPRRPKGR